MLPPRNKILNFGFLDNNIFIYGTWGWKKLLTEAGMKKFNPLGEFTFALSDKCKLN